MVKIEEIWNKGNEQLSKDEMFSVEFIKNAISESSNSITSKFVKTIWTPIVITFLAIIMLVYNGFFYLNNTPILVTIIGLTILSILIIIFLLIQINKLKIIDTKSTDLHDLLVNKIKHFNLNLKYVFHGYAFSVVLATFTINLTIENSDGIFELRKILMLSVYYILVYFALIYLFKTMNSIYLKRLKNALFNLEESTYNRIDKAEKKYKKIKKKFLIIVIVVLILGLIAAYIKAYI